MEKITDIHVTDVKENKNLISIDVETRTISGNGVYNIDIDAMFGNSNEHCEIIGIVRQLKSYARNRTDIENAIGILKTTSLDCRECIYLVELQYMAISMFVKCFQSNAKDAIRIKLDEKKIYDENDMKKIFDEICTLRNKHIMHDEDYMNASKCIAEYDGSSVKILKTLDCEIVLLDDEMINKIIMLMEKALDYCKNKYDDIGKKLKTMLGEVLNEREINDVLKYEVGAKKCQ